MDSPSKEVKPVAINPEKNKDIKILIAEDYEVSRKMLRIMVEKYTPWKVVEAVDGVDALEKIKESKPDAVLLDIMMPRMDGYEVLQHLRAEPETVNLPVLILTGMKTPESEVKSLELGSDDYLTKPIKREILIARLKKVLAAKKQIASVIQSTAQPAPPKIEEDSDSITEFKLI
jgi:DNA-binding response OmpR family regulator